MPESIGPAIARDRLSARLRELRDSRRLTSAEVAERLAWPESAIEEAESGSGLLSPAKLTAILEVYGVSGPALESMLLLDHVARSRLWWARHGMTDEHQDFVAYESEAHRICVYQPLVVPGLLQTRRYALAATATILRLSEDAPDVTARADIRMERQHMVADRVAAGERVRIVAVVDEIVLRRHIGGPEVMREQLDHLADQAGLDHVTLVVMPTSAGGHAGLGGVFELLEHKDDPDLSMVFIEAAASDQVVRGPRVATLYQQIVGDLVATGRSGEEAIAMVRRAREEIRS